MFTLSPRFSRLPARLVAAVLLVATAASAPTPAVAQNKPPGPDDPYADEAKPPPAAPTGTAPPDPYDDVNKKLAADSFSAGVKLAGKGQWQEAYEKFRSAWSDFKHWQTASSLAKAELELGKYTDAVRHLESALREANVPPAARAEIEKLLQKAKAATGTLQIQATCRLPAAVLVDGEKIGDTPYSGPVMADPGEHQVEVRLEDRREETTVDLHTGETVEVTLELRIPLPPAPPAPPLPPPPPPVTPKLPFAIGLSALTGIGLVTGAVLATSADEAWRIGGIAALGTAGALGVTSGVLWYLVLSGPPSPPGPSPARTVLLPVAGPGHGGFSLQGMF